MNLLFTFLGCAALCMEKVHGTTTLKTFEEVVNALNNGLNVRYVANYSQCYYSYNQSQQGPGASGGYQISEFEYFWDPYFGSQPFFAISQSELIENYGGYGNSAFIYDFVKTTAYSNSTVVITAIYLSSNLKNITMVETFTCSINDGTYWYTNDDSSSVSSVSSHIDKLRRLKSSMHTRDSRDGDSSDGIVGSVSCDDILLILFNTYIRGEFDNSLQINNESKNGTDWSSVTHPYAYHISDIMNQKITNIPDDMTGFFILEESYYTYHNQPTVASPFIFYFSSVTPAKKGIVKANKRGTEKEMSSNYNNVMITNYQANGINITQLRNNNTRLKIDYSQLSLATDFTPSVYQYFDNNSSFYLNSVTVNTTTNTTFTLIETIAQYQLRVLEQVNIDGENIVPYNTPLIYDRL